MKIVIVNPVMFICICFVLLIVFASCQFWYLFFYLPELEYERSSYTFYLDGIEVSQDKFDYHLYKYRIDDFHKKIFARSK